jgi:hypothetical protein
LLSGAGILISGTPSIKIGTTAGGADILPLTALTTTLNPAVFQQYFGALQILYITISGGGTASLRLDVINNYI